MSKKSSSRIGSGVDSEDQEFCSERNNCKAPTRFTQSEEGISRGPSGDQSSTRNILQRNTEASPRCETNSSSHSSLDNELYGTSDVFNNNLAFLKHKLYVMRIIDSNQATQSCSGEYEHPNNYRAIDTTENAICVNIHTSFGRTDIDAPLPPISTIYETSEASDTENTVSSTSYRVPKKRVCFGEDSEGHIIDSKASKISLISSPKSIDLSVKNQTSEELSSPQSPISRLSDITYDIPFKKKCIESFCLDPVSYRGIEACTPPFVKSTFTQCTRKKKIAEKKLDEAESSPYSDNLDLSLNLPSSTTDNCESTSKLTPLEPNIIILEPAKNETKRTMIVSKLSPCKVSKHTTNTHELINTSPSPETSNNESFNSEQYQNTPEEIIERYYLSTPEFTSNASTPTYVVSTIESANNSKDITPKPVTAATLKSTSPKGFHPYLSSSLAVPKISSHLYNFPAISKITTCLGCHVAGDDSRIAGAAVQDHGNADNENTELINLVSATSDQSTRKSSTPRKVHPEIKEINKNCLADKRKEQCTDISFYSYSTDPSVNTTAAERSPDAFSNSPSSENDSTPQESVNTDCCCLKFFFPKRKKRFFV